MYVCVFIDWENIEKNAKQEYGSVLNYEPFVEAIRRVATSNGSRLVGIQAYGDFDKGTAGLMSKLVNLGIEPKHVVTKTAQEYLKGSTDIELSLDILETMYNYPHITDFLFVSGDGDMRHVIIQSDGREFVGLNYFRKRLVDYYQDNATQISDALTDCLDYGLLEAYQVANPRDEKHPTTACRLALANPAVQYILRRLK